MTSTSAPLEQSRARLRPPPWWLTAAWAAVALGGLARFAAAKLGFVFLCPLRTVTGIPCPTCGATHALMHLVRLCLPDAFRANPLVALLGFGTVALCFVATPLWLTGRLPGIRIGERGLTFVRVGVVVATLANWVYLLLTLR